MSRKSARENAFRLVYEYLETGERNDFTRELLCGRDVPADSEFTKRIYDTVLQNFAYIKSVIERYSKDFAFDRIYKTDLSALTVAVCELLYLSNIHISDPNRQGMN